MTSQPGSESWKSTERRFELFAFAAVTILIAVFLLRDASAFVNNAQDELIGHVGASGGFTVAAAGTLIIFRGARPSLLLVVVAGAVITIAGELAQGLVPDRGVELRDIVTGFGGVLLAGIVIELLLRSLALLPALRIHALAAGVASIVLAVLLIFDLAPETILTAAPDGESCPLTAITGAGERITIGDDIAVTNGCFRSESGGFGLFGPDDARSLRDDTVLVSSELTDLTEAIASTGRVVLRTEFTTDSFPEDVRRTGTIAILFSEEAGELLQVRTHDTRIEVYGPSAPDPFRSALLSQVLEENRTYAAEIELDGGSLTTRIDGEIVATTAIDPDWVEVLEEDALRLLIGNGRARTLPFHGVIEWIEVDT